MDFLSKYINELNIEIIENKERINFVNRESEHRYIDNDINKDSINSFGYFFVDLLNKENEIVSFFDKLISTISDSKSSIYDSFEIISMDFLRNYNHISDFIPFYLHILNKKMSENLQFKNDSERKLLETIESEEKLKEIANSKEEDLKEYWKKDVFANKYTDLNSYKESIEDRMLGAIFYKTTLQSMCEEYSPNKCKENMISLIKKDKEKYLECIDSLDFYLDIDRKTYTKKQVDYINRETIIPRCRKLICFEKNKTYYRYSSISKRNKDVSREEIDNLGEPISMNIYEINSINELLDLYVSFFIDKRIDLRKCENCGKYFISEYGTKYCNNISPQDTNKTCIEIVPKFKYSNKEIPKKYNTIVNRYRSKISHTENYVTKKEYKKELEEFKKEYGKMKKLRTKETDLEKWLDNKMLEYDKKHRNK